MMINIDSRIKLLIMNLSNEEEDVYPNPDIVIKYDVNTSRIEGEVKYLVIWLGKQS